MTGTTARSRLKVNSLSNKFRLKIANDVANKTLAGEFQLRQQRNRGGIDRILEHCFGYPRMKHNCFRQKTHLMSQEEVVLKPGEDFLCTQCNLSLIGQRYILNDERPYCVSCYEQQFSNTCESCKEKIKCDSKDLSFKEKHWHEKCFFCSVCKASLADKPFTTKDSDLFCPDCYDEKFSPRCDGCKKIFKAGSRKYEYKGSTWHEECFTCIECKQPLGTKSFVPKDDGVVCVPCYEEKYSQRCFKCTKPIQKGGVTYKGQPWHKTCFLCVNCNTELSGQKFTSKDDQPYCADCYTQLFAKRCHKCTKPISGGSNQLFYLNDRKPVIICLHVFLSVLLMDNTETQLPNGFEIYTMHNEHI
ncbi:hypothetical protein P879_06646 [Paragonimus westermani]|uniref:LIM zinc-binding domain-containing protein n=1 Tax=Paragonimus westermani TaxID=34504 RepID=A0A8T0DLL3_9TREM|nr:hypothetical protein P879_06646 [Paragonimus westermani]